MPTGLYGLKGMFPKKGTQVFRFILVGFSNAVITYIIYVAMRRWMHFGEEVSNAAGYIVALVNNFVWSKLWVFQTRATNVWREIVLFAFSFLVAYGCQFTFFKLMITHTEKSEYLWQFLGLFIYGAVNFLMNKKLTFNHPR